jgi:4-aminobutyrate aminotransferase-like enzyme
MAAVEATLGAIEDEGMLDNALAVEGFLREGLAGVSAVAGVRGRGLLLGVEFVEPLAGKVQKALLERRIITGTSSDPKVLRLLPPLCVTEGEAAMFVEALKEVLP